MIKFSTVVFEKTRFKDASNFLKQGVVGNIYLRFHSADGMESSEDTMMSLYDYDVIITKSHF